MHRDTIHRPFDSASDEASRNVAWYLLQRRQSSHQNLTIAIQHFQSGGFFADHKHDFEQFFYVTHGRFEMTISGETMILEEGDFIFIERNESHSGVNISAEFSELLYIDYWPPDSQSTLGLD